jgi:hypothetical protein
MGRCALRTLTRMRVALTRRLQLSASCRFDAVATTPLHIQTVRLTTDNPDPDRSPRPPQRDRNRGHLWSPSCSPSPARAERLSIGNQYIDGPTWQHSAPGHSPRQTG